MSASGCRSLLLVDGNEIERAGMTSLLQRAGYNVLAALNTAHAIDLLRKYRPDLILLNAHLPSGGTKAFAAMKAQECVSVPVIALVRRGESVTDSLNAAGAVDKLLKPMSGDELLETVKKYCP